jgi:uncharacterized membrane protein YpjA
MRRVQLSIHLLSMDPSLAFYHTKQVFFLLVLLKIMTLHTSQRTWIASINILDIVFGLAFLSSNAADLDSVCYHLLFMAKTRGSCMLFTYLGLALMSILGSCLLAICSTLARLACNTYGIWRVLSEKFPKPEKKKLFSEENALMYNMYRLETWGIMYSITCEKNLHRG